MGGFLSSPPQPAASMSPRHSSSVIRDDTCARRSTEDRGHDLGRTAPSPPRPPTTAPEPPRRGPRHADVTPGADGLPARGRESFSSSSSPPPPHFSFFPPTHPLSHGRERRRGKARRGREGGREKRRLPTRGMMGIDGVHQKREREREKRTKEEVQKALFSSLHHR